MSNTERNWLQEVHENGSLSFLVNRRGRFIGHLSGQTILG
jgi:hypothetical protein